ncbi:MAG TPA: DNA-processing protein DprA [Vicinamibacterales bacterium]|nr:DNA-processing protein DprA [Vicinamibacterales bacterium]
MPLLVDPAPARSTDLIALSLTPFGWRRRLGERLRAGESPSAILGRLLAARGGADGLDRPTLMSRVAVAIARAIDSGLHLIAWSDASYPAALSAIADPPPVLWLRGNPEALSPRAVAIVGSRAGSPYALAVAERLAADLSSRGIVVVSGLARGVDSAAHRGALAGKGPTLAVLGCGADVIYPAEHRDLANAVAAGGAIVSELVPGTPPKKQFFPLRNRIISGLSRAVLIVEAGEKSGSLITARCALEQGRDVLAVPGNVLSGRNRGGHALIKDGAKIVESADDILEELGLPSPGTRAAGGPEDPVLAGLPAGESCDLDVIAERTGLASSRLLPRLFELELAGLIRRVGGGRFARI